MKGAGGTAGGILTFLSGLIMMCGGFCLLFNSIVVNARFGLGYLLQRQKFLGLATGCGVIVRAFVRPHQQHKFQHAEYVCV